MDKVLSYIRKGVLTATILISLLGSVKGAEKEEILNTVKKEAPEYINFKKLIFH